MNVAGNSRTYISLEVYKEPHGYNYNISNGNSLLFHGTAVGEHDNETAKKVLAGIWYDIHTAPQFTTGLNRALWQAWWELEVKIRLGLEGVTHPRQLVDTLVWADGLMDTVTGEMNCFGTHYTVGKEADALLSRNRIADCNCAYRDKYELELRNNTINTSIL